MKNIYFVLLTILTFAACSRSDDKVSTTTNSKKIGEFISVVPNSQNERFIIPNTHKFQKIIKTGEVLSGGSLMPERSDFTGYLPISNSSTDGYLGVNSESTPGGVTVLDINFDASSKLWNLNASEKINFNQVGGTARNCSGTITPWGTMLTSEEAYDQQDINNDGYKDNGWIVEVDLVSKTVIDKRWALGFFPHEGVVIHSNERTVYQGVDSGPNGFLYKFVADTPQDLNSGDLYVYVGPKNGTGTWAKINNDTQQERNTTLAQSQQQGGAIFNGIEDVEIGPDGRVYFADKGDGLIYRFYDSDPLLENSVINIETFVGGHDYQISHDNGSTIVPWGIGNDNLAFDNEGNLWVLQDGDNNYIWVVDSNHTQSIPKVRLFGIAPFGGEPTGITFTPDFKFLFMSIQHPNTNNTLVSVDAANNNVVFNESVSLVIALNGNMGDFN